MDGPVAQERIAQTETVLAPEYRTIENCEIEVPRASALIIFGASGDLAHRKLLPSLYRLYKNRMLAEDFFILGTSRIEMTTEQFRASMLESVREAHPNDFDQPVWDALVTRIYYSTLVYVAPESYSVNLKDILP
jgi:glucose-6-phosphate 1-dehydrogenase